MGESHLARNPQGFNLAARGEALTAKRAPAPLIHPWQHQFEQHRHHCGDHDAVGGEDADRLPHRVPAGEV